MPLGWWLGLQQGGGAQGMWISLIVGLSAAALLLTVRFVRRTRPEGLTRTA
jgi:multidrug resistance protein, MATE family